MGKLAQPLVPEGPIRRFYDRLHELHRIAGEPSVRALQRATRGGRRPNGINPTTIHDAFSAPRLPRWEVVEAIVEQLDGDASEMSALWRSAREAELTTMDQATTGQATTANATTTLVPRELPADIHGFTGREVQLKELDELLDRGQDPVTIAAVVGPGGVGKTALAVHWGHRVREHFPDGDLYVNLRGFAAGDTRVRPVDALAQFLRTLGVPSDQIPPDPAEAASRYRSVLAGRRLLILLDNAAEPDQIRPLLPGGTGCLVVVTSRDRLGGLVARDGARQLRLDVLEPRESRTLLSRMLGAERMEAESEAVDELAQACSHLPLALRVAATNLSQHPQRRVAAHVTRLRQEDGLALLDVDDDEQTGVARSFDLSYHAACPDGQRLFRLLGLLPVPDITAGSAAALVELPVAEVERLLDRLAGAHLVYEHSPGRYGWHDLVQQYAAARAHRDEPAADRADAVGRWCEWHLHAAEAAANVLYPGRLRLPTPFPPGSAGVEFADQAAAVAWLDEERANLVSVVTHAADHGAPQVAWLLASTLHGYLWMGMHLVDWLRAAQAALAAGEAEGDQPAQAAALISLGNAHARQNRHREAIDFYARGLVHAESGGWVEGQAALLGSLGIMHRDLGDLFQATEYLHRAYLSCQECGSRGAEAVTLGSLSGVHLLRGQLSESLAYCQQALALYRAAGLRQGEAAVLDDIGEICHLQGRLAEAEEHIDLALSIAREIGDRGVEAITTRRLAALQRDAGYLQQAMRLAKESIVLARRFDDDRIMASAYHVEATIYDRLGRQREAVSGHHLALRLAGATDDHYLEVEALLGLASAMSTLGRSDEAIAHATRARDLAHRAGYALLEQRARTDLEQIGAGAH